MQKEIKGDTSVSTWLKSDCKVSIKFQYIAIRNWRTIYQRVSLVCLDVIVIDPLRRYVVNDRSLDIRMHDRVVYIFLKIIDFTANILKFVSFFIYSRSRQKTYNGIYQYDFILIWYEIIIQTFVNMKKLFRCKVAWQRKIKDDSRSKGNVCLLYVVYFTFESNSDSLDTTVVLFHIDPVLKFCIPRIQKQFSAIEYDTTLSNTNQYDGAMTKYDVARDTSTE